MKGIPIPDLQILTLEVLPGSVVAKPDEHLMLVAEQRRCREVGGARQHAAVAVRPLRKEEYLRVRDMAFHHPNLQSVFPDAQEHFIAALRGQAAEGTADILHRGGLPGDDRGHVVHGPRVTKHAFDARFLEPLENGAQHLCAGRVGEDPNAAVRPEFIKIKFACLDSPSVEHPRSSPRGIGWKQPGSDGALGA